MATFRVLLAAAVMLCSSMATAANGFDPQQLLFGAGISRNEVGPFDSTGFQVFTGYQFGEVARNIQVDAEVGYMDTGNFSGARSSAEGLWTTGVLRLLVSPQIELLGRAGLDFGDDDGLMVGAGAGFTLTRDWRMRVEYVARDDVDSLQLNFVFKP